MHMHGSVSGDLSTSFLDSRTCIYIYTNMCEREREGEGEKEREREIEREREGERKRERRQSPLATFMCIL